MCTPNHIAEAMASKGEGDMDATTIAMCDLEGRIASETGLSEQALRQLMKEAFLPCSLATTLLSIEIFHAGGRRIRGCGIAGDGAH
jgi:hypothetical protein